MSLKKWLGGWGVFLLVLGLAACGSEDTPGETPPTDGDSDRADVESLDSPEGELEGSEGESACHPGCINNVAIGCYDGKERRQDCKLIIGGGECTIGMTPNDVFCSGIDRPQETDGDLEMDHEMY